MQNDYIREQDALAVVTNDGLKLQHVDPCHPNYYNIVLAAIDNNIEAVAYVPRDIPEGEHDDSEDEGIDSYASLIQHYIDTKGYDILKHIPEHIWSDNWSEEKGINEDSLLFMLCYTEGAHWDSEYAEMLFGHLPESFKINESFVSFYVKQEGMRLEHLSDEQKKNRRIALTAVIDNTNAFQFVHENLKNDYLFVLQTLQEAQGGNLALIFESITPGLKNNRNLLSAALENIYADGFEALNVDGVDASHKKDRDLMLKAIKSQARRFKLIYEVFQCDRDFVLEAVKLRGEVIRFIAKYFLQDKEIILAAIKNDFRSFAYVEEPLKSDHNVIFAAIQSMQYNEYQFFEETFKYEETFENQKSKTYIRTPTDRFLCENPFLEIPISYWEENPELATKVCGYIPELIEKLSPHIPNLEDKITNANIFEPFDRKETGYKKLTETHETKAKKKFVKDGITEEIEALLSSKAETQKKELLEECLNRLNFCDAEELPDHVYNNRFRAIIKLSSGKNPMPHNPLNFLELNDRLGKSTWQNNSIYENEIQQAIANLEYYCEHCDQNMTYLWGHRSLGSTLEKILTTLFAASSIMQPHPLTEGEKTESELFLTNLKEVGVSMIESLTNKEGQPACNGMQEGPEFFSSAQQNRGEVSDQPTAISNHPAETSDQPAAKRAKTDLLSQ